MGTIGIREQPEFELLLEISQILEEEINERGFDDVHVDTESLTKGFNITPIPE